MRALALSAIVGAHASELAWYRGRSLATNMLTGSIPSTIGALGNATLMYDAVCVCVCAREILLPERHYSHPRKACCFYTTET